MSVSKLFYVFQGDPPTLNDGLRSNLLGEGLVAQLRVPPSLSWVGCGQSFAARPASDRADFCSAALQQAKSLFFLWCHLLCRLLFRLGFSRTLRSAPEEGIEHRRGDEIQQGHERELDVKAPLKSQQIAKPA